MPDQSPPTNTSGSALPDLPSSQSVVDTLAVASESQDASSENPHSTLQQSPEHAVLAASESISFQPGTVVPGFQIVRELGRGAMGVVYEARHQSLNRTVALKMLLAGQVVEKDWIRFLAEAEAVAAINHPNVVVVYDYGEVNGRPYMALEFLSGGSLSTRLEQHGRFSVRDAIQLMIQITAGVAAAHEQGIVHRDLKPHNVLLSADGEPKVADFGLAKRASNELTATQAVMGTPSYMSPEQAGGKTKYVGPTADVWALGVMLHECLSGARPFPGHTTNEVLAKILTAEPQPLRSLVKDIPRDLELICRKCLEKNPSDRYPSARELSEDLTRFQNGEPISIRSLGPVTRTLRWSRRNPLVASLLAAVFFITIGLFSSLYTQYQQAIARADSERLAKESAESARQQSELARDNAERAAQETTRREEADRLRKAAEQRATLVAAQAAQADDLIGLLDDLFRSSDPLVGFFGDALPSISPVVAHGGQAEVLGPFLQNALRRFRASLTDPSVVLVRAKLLSSIGNALKGLGLITEAKSALLEALEIRRAHLPESHPDLWKSELDMGRIDTESGDYLSAIERFKRVKELQRKADATEDARLTTQLYQGVALSTAGMAEAESVLQDLVTQREKLSGKSHKDTLLAKIALVTCLLEKGKWTDALKHFNELREAILEIPETENRIRSILISVLDCQGALALGYSLKNSSSLPSSLFQNSVKGLKTKLAQLEKLLPEEHVLLIIFRFELAKFLLELGEGPEADALFTRVLADGRKTAGLAHPKMLAFLDAYVHRLAATKRVGEARELLAEVENANRIRFGGDNPWLSLIHFRGFVFEFEYGERNQALLHAQKAVALIERGAFLPTASNLRDMITVVDILGLSGNPPALRQVGLQLLKLSRPFSEAASGESSETKFSLLLEQTRQYYRYGLRAESLECAKEAELHLPKLVSIQDGSRRLLSYWQGQLALDRGHFNEAEQHFRESLMLSKKTAAKYPANWEEDTLMLVIALAGQRKYREAGQYFEEYFQSRKRLKLSEQDVAGLQMRKGMLHLAAGERDEYASLVQQMTNTLEKSTNTNSQARLCWTAGLTTLNGIDAKEHARIAAAVISRSRNFPWGFQGLALVQFRAGNLKEAEEALLKANRPGHPLSLLIGGLIAAAEGDSPAARGYLRFAEEVMAAQKPNDRNLFAYAGTYWYERVHCELLLAELRSLLEPPQAPMPREK